MSPEERSESASLAARIRWDKDKRIQLKTLVRLGGVLVRTPGPHAHLANNQHVYSSSPLCYLCGKRFNLPK